MPARSPATLAALALLAAGCAGGQPRRAIVPTTGLPPGRSPAAIAAADRGRPPYTTADVRFLSGMIPHHAQAVLMAGWAESRGAGRAVSAMCARIVVAQRDEIAFMQTWLRDRGLPVPDSDSAHFLMAGMDHALMPGMLTAAELLRLEGSRGAAFDRLFLEYMIRHHRGAIRMVEELFAAHGAAQDEDVFKFASDVHVDQITEIEFMGRMLAAMTGGER